MALSLQKLERLLRSRGLIPKRIFTINDMCVYLEVLVLDNAESFLLYIPSKYDIGVLKGSNVFRISHVEVNEDGTIAGDYAKDPDNVELEKKYEEVDIDIDPDIRKHKDVESHLENNYNHPLSLKDLTKDDMQQLREVFRQLKRLRLCVKNLKYKLCITFKNYLCCIRRDDSFEGFIIRGPPGGAERKMFVSIDLEALYGKLGSVAIDIKTVREGIYKVLNKNQMKHTRNLQKILENKMDFVKSSEFIEKKKEKYTKYLNQLEELLEVLLKAERETREKVALVGEHYDTETSLKGLHTDIEKSHQVAKHEKELANISNVKQEVTKNLLNVKSKLEDLSLRVDNVCFDNLVMLDAILKNFVGMTEL